MSVFGMVFEHCRMALCGISAECSLYGVEISADTAVGSFILGRSLS